MDTAIVDVSQEPPTGFESETQFKHRGTWQTDQQMPGAGLIGDGPCDPVSSSSCIGTLGTWLESPTSTTSWTSLIELISDLLRAERRAASVNISDAPENLFELRRLTGFTWIRLADLLGVDRRTLNNWVKGAKIRQLNREHIAKTLEVLRFADRGSVEYNAEALDKRHDGSSPFKAIQTKNYEIAKHYLSYGLSRPYGWHASTDSTSWLGEFQPMVLHAGTEMVEPFPDEPALVSRKRSIKRD